jgi:16S rRNA (guanine966-N2)-methyltransferase
MARITGGQFKGVNLIVPASIRATEAKVRQAVFNILGSFVEGARVADVFAGSGALGLEALSRGAQFCAFIESDAQAVIAIRDNLAHLERDLPRSAWRVIHGEAAWGLRQLATSEPPFDVILLDPPYRSAEGKKALNTVVECAMLAHAGVIVLEHDQRMELPASVGCLRRGTQHRYGDTVLSLYQQAEPS